MKRKFALLGLLACTLAIGLVACGKGQDNGNNGGNNDNSSSYVDSAPEAHVCVGGFDYDYNDEGHVLKCECGEIVESGAHVKNPVLLSDGETEWYACVICDAKMEEREHTTHTPSDSMDGNNTQHWQECTLCGEKLGAATHNLAAEWIKTEDGHYKECSDCDVKVDEDGHEQGSAWVNDGDVHVSSCKDCGETLTENHAAGDTYKAGADTHWNECVCGAKVGEEAHQISRIIAQENGVQAAYCACGELFGTVDTKLKKQAIDMDSASGTVKATTATIDLSGITDLEYSVKSVAIGGVDVSGELDEKGGYTFSLDAFGIDVVGQEKDLMATLLVGGAELTVRSTAIFATKVINEFSELSILQAMDANVEIFGYYVLGQDIDGNGAQLATPVQIGNQTKGFRGTFDGCGYTISNFNTGNYGIFGNLAYESEIKNVTLNVNRAGSNVIAYAARSAKITNVTVSIKETLYTGWYELVSEINNSTVTDLTVTYVDGLVFDGAHLLCKTHSGSTFTNVRITTNYQNAEKITASGTPDGVLVTKVGEE